MADYTDITPDDQNYFATNRRRIDQTYGYGLAQDQFQRQTVGDTFNSQLGDLKAQYAQSRTGLSSPYAKAGLLNSGIYAHALDQFQANRTRQTGDLTSAYNTQLGGLALADRQLEQVRSSGLSDVDAAEKARRATVASGLNSIGL